MDILFQLFIHFYSACKRYDSVNGNNSSFTTRKYMTSFDQAAYTDCW